MAVAPGGPSLSEPTPAVFVSYASQDAAAAERLCQALRGAGIDVWFDRSELRGGDAWDAAIRRQIKSCTLYSSRSSRTTPIRARNGTSGWSGNWLWTDRS